MQASIYHRRAKLSVLVAVTAITALLHYLIPTDRHDAHMLHIALRKLYFLPPVMAGAWFGLRGSVPTTAAVSVLLSVHALHDWPGNYMEQANQIGELAGFWTLGLVSGWLFDRQRMLTERLTRSKEETCLALVSALDLRERHTARHSQRVREYALLLAGRLGVSEEEKQVIGTGALLHDIGKIAVSDRILLKPGKLSNDEWEEVRRHSNAGHLLLGPIGSLAAAAEIVYAHHERFDGTGYPRGLRGEDIPLGARIFAVADAFDALTSDRPYRKSSGYEEASRIISEGSGAQFDPRVVAVFRTVRPGEWVLARLNCAGTEAPYVPLEHALPIKAA